MTWCELGKHEVGEDVETLRHTVTGSDELGNLRDRETGQVSCMPCIKEAVKRGEVDYWKAEPA